MKRIIVLSSLLLLGSPFGLLPFLLLAQDSSLPDKAPYPYLDRQGSENHDEHEDQLLPPHERLRRRMSREQNVNEGYREQRMEQSEYPGAQGTEDESYRNEMWKNHPPHPRGQDDMLEHQPRHPSSSSFEPHYGVGGTTASSDSVLEAWVA